MYGLGFSEKRRYSLQMDWKDSMYRKDTQYVVKKQDEVEPRALSRPSAPSGFHASDVTENGATLSWRSPVSVGAGPITKYTVERREATKSAWIYVDAVDSFTHTCKIRNLYEGKDYYFRVFAENKFGTGEPAELTEPVRLRSAEREYMQTHAYRHLLVYSTQLLLLSFPINCCLDF